MGRPDQAEGKRLWRIPVWGAGLTNTVAPTIWGIPTYVSSQLSVTETQGSSSSVASSVYVLQADQVVVVRRQDFQVIVDRSRLFNQDMAEIRSLGQFDIVRAKPQSDRAPHRHSRATMAATKTTQKPAQEAAETARHMLHGDDTASAPEQAHARGYSPDAARRARGAPETLKRRRVGAVSPDIPRPRQRSPDLTEPAPGPVAATTTTRGR